MKTTRVCFSTQVQNTDECGFDPPRLQMCVFYSKKSQECFTSLLHLSLRPLCCCTRWSLHSPAFCALQPSPLSQPHVYCCPAPSSPAPREVQPLRSFLTLACDGVISSSPVFLPTGHQSEPPQARKWQSLMPPRDTIVCTSDTKMGTERRLELGPATKQNFTYAETIKTCNNCRGSVTLQHNKQLFFFFSNILARSSLFLPPPFPPLQNKTRRVKKAENVP